MATRVYFSLNEEQVRALIKTTKNEVFDRGLPAGSHTTHSILGLAVYPNAGEWYCQFDDSLDLVPPLITPFVTRVTILIDGNPFNAPRECGIYRGQEGADGQVERNPHAYPYSSKNSFLVKISAKNLGDARELLRKIQAGSIRPAVSYDTPQGGKSRAELETELESQRGATREVIENAALERNEHAKQLLQHEMQFCSAEARADRLEHQLGAVVAECNLHINEGGWPFCHRAALAAEIKRVALRNSAPGAAGIISA